MAQAARALFSISGLRGVYPDTLTTDLVATYVRAFAQFTGPGAVAIGMDTRASGPELARTVIEVLSAAGRDVIDLGIVPTPTLVFAVRDIGAAGGLMVTASHNPMQWNGLKFVAGDGRFLNPGEVDRLRRQLTALRRTPAGGRGTRRTDPGAVDRHIAAILDHPFFRGGRAAALRVGVDACEGAAFEAGPELLRTLGCEVFELHCGSSGEFPRGPEPTRENLAKLGRLVREHHLDLGLAFDPDGDRLGIVDEQGTPVGEEATLTLACGFVLGRQPGPVVVNLSTTQAVADVVAAAGGTLERTPVGEAAVVEQALRSGAVLAGEGNGGVILPSLNRTRDGLVAAALIVALRVESATRVSALVRALPVYHQQKTTSSLPPERWPAAQAALEAEFAAQVLDRTDGLRITDHDQWVHVRPSNTEPVIRIIAETPDAQRTAALVARVEQVLVRLGREGV